MRLSNYSNEIGGKIQTQTLGPYFANKICVSITQQTQCKNSNRIQ